MSKLDELRSFVAKQFEKATTEDEIKSSALINNLIDQVATEQQEMNDKFKELLNDYKDVVKHTSFKSETKIEDAPKVSSAPSFEDFLSNYKPN